MTDAATALPCWQSVLAALRDVGPTCGWRDIVHEIGCDGSLDECDTDSSTVAAIATASEAAASCDVAVVVVGGQSGLATGAGNTCGEFHDRMTLTLPGAQTALIKAVHATGAWCGVCVFVFVFVCVCVCVCVWVCGCGCGCGCVGVGVGV